MKTAQPLLRDLFPPQKEGVIRRLVALSLIAHLVLAGSLYYLRPPSLNSVLSAPAETFSFVLQQTEVRPAKPVVKPRHQPKPLLPPKREPKKIISTKKPSSKTIAQRSAKTQPVKKPAQKSQQKSQQKVEPIKPKAAPASSPAPIQQQASAVPKPSYRPKPKYPAVAKRRGIEGTVTFEVFLANSGVVNNVIMTESSGSSLLDKSALKAIKTWRFPANRFNSLASFKQRIVFKLVQSY